MTDITSKTKRTLTGWAASLNFATFMYAIHLFDTGAVAAMTYPGLWAVAVAVTPALAFVFFMTWALWNAPGGPTK